jgi:hypothetical protein
MYFTFIWSGGEGSGLGYFINAYFSKSYQIQSLNFHLPQSPKKSRQFSNKKNCKSREIIMTITTVFGAIDCKNGDLRLSLKKIWCFFILEDIIVHLTTTPTSCILKITYFSSLLIGVFLEHYYILF